MTILPRLLMAWSVLVVVSIRDLGAFCKALNVWLHVSADSILLRVLNIRILFDEDFMSMFRERMTCKRRKRSRHWRSLHQG